MPEAKELRESGHGEDEAATCGGRLDEDRGTDDHADVVEGGGAVVDDDLGWSDVEVLRDGV